MWNYSTFCPKCKQKTFINKCKAKIF
ncbi:MAG: hypothetical protein HFJ09_10855 [Lachnospiraceae bacterium]|nr:hypothetical protein [Lachnospiraceae bacterium]